MMMLPTLWSERSPPALEAVVEDLGQVLAPGEGDQAVAHVARRRHPELLPQPAARAAVVRHGDDRGEVADAIAQPS